jgi:hypothetical protein
VVGLIAFVVIAGALTAVLIQTGAVEPTPAATVTVFANNPRWTPTGLQCNGGDTFTLKATGRILQQKTDRRSEVGPAGWVEEVNPGYAGPYTEFSQGPVNPGALIGGLTNPGALIDGGLTSVDPDLYFTFQEDGTATYECGPNVGTLALGVNDVVFTDNEGSFTVKVWSDTPPE